MSGDGTGAMRGVLIDSCGASATMALLRGDGERCDEVRIAGREFSAAWPAALRGLLGDAGWDVGELEIVGVVRGPGSFTGVRVGLAAAKGLCEAVRAKLIAVSRLEVMASLAGEGSVAVLDAGRGEFYVRDGGMERLMTLAEVQAVAAGREVVAVEARVAEMFGVEMQGLDALAAEPLAMERWREGAFDDVAATDANYVRGEREIYAKKAVA